MPVKIRPFITKRFLSYEVPERYRNSFYLANAAFFDQVNWYLHRAYEIAFPKLLTWLKDEEPNLTNKEATNKITTIVEVLDQCNSIIDIRFPIQRESGRREVIRGFRAQYGLYSGFTPCLGGLRMTEDVTRDHMKALATLSTYKHACMGVRLAGGHGAIKINPKQYTELELKRIVKKYAAELYLKGFCDGKCDVIEPDINVGGREMAWIASIFPEGYEKVMVAGKPAQLGGMENYPEMASQAIFFALDFFINNESVLEEIAVKEKGLDQKTFIIQGLGTLGSALAKFLEKNGAICVGIKEHDAYIYDPKGVNVQDATRHLSQHGSLQMFSTSKPLVNDDVYKEECDILILAAHQKSLSCYVADKVKARIVVEAANGAITPAAHRILVGRSKLVLPDVYVSSGHAIASYLEFLLGLRKSGKEFPVIRRLYKHILETWESSEVKCQMVSSATTQKIVSCEMNADVLTYAIEHVMRETGNELLEIGKEFKLGLDLRIAGYIKAIQSIHKSVYDLKKY